MTEPKNIQIDCLGYKIAADWYDTDIGQVLLILPGYPSTKKKYEPFVQEMLQRTGFSVLVIDYAGLGESPYELNQVSRADNFSDVVASFDWLAENYPNKKITVIGTSYGGFHAAYLTAFREVDSLILRVPAYYSERTMYTKHSEHNRNSSREYRKELQNVKDKWMFGGAKSFQGRAFVITHEYDDVCPPIATRPFVEVFKADHWEAPGFEHGFSESNVTKQQTQEYYAKIAEWLKK